MAEAVLQLQNTQPVNNVVQFPEMPKRQSNKKKGRKSEVYPFQLEDMKKMLDYYKEKEMWNHYLAFTLGCNMARRAGDTLELTWEHFYNPQTGKLRDEILEIVEDKTDKLANPRINSACREAINLYIEKTGVDVTKNNYKELVFLQLSGTHKGKPLSYDGYRKALKKAALAVGITYNVGTHSTRKTFGMISRMLHPNDYDSMELLQTIYNHSDTKTTKSYIGLTKQKVDQYYDDFGTFFDDYVVGDKEYEGVSDKPVISIEVSDLRDVIKMAYFKDRTDADAMQAVESINEIMGIIEGLVK